MNALIWIAKDQLKRNEETKIFYCKLGLVKRLAGMKDSSNLGLKKALISLSHTNFEYNVLNKDKNKRGVFSFLAEASITEQGR